MLGDLLDVRELAVVCRDDQVLEEELCSQVGECLAHEPGVFDVAGRVVKVARPVVLVRPFTAIVSDGWL